MASVDVTPGGNWDDWLEQEVAANDQAAADAGLWAAAFATQMVTYFALWYDAVDNRDDVLDKQKDILDYMENQAATVDYEMLLCKQAICTDLECPTLNACTDPLKCADEGLLDGEVVDSKAQQQLERTCNKAPDGWDTNEGELYAHRGVGYAGGIIHNANKRRTERFLENKTALMARAQASARIAPGPILAGYQQAASIHEGLAGIFLRGFQSAGAGLGVSLERLSGNNSSGGYY